MIVIEHTTNEARAEFCRAYIKAAQRIRRLAVLRALIQRAYGG